MIKIGILSSHNGSGFDALYEAIQDNKLNAEVSVVISNNSSSNVLKNAKKRNISNYVVNSKIYENENLDEKITNLLKEHKCDYIFLSGYMKKIEKNLLKSFENKIFNSHPSLLPAFGGHGMYGSLVHEAVIKQKASKTGVTIHYVNENYDEGEYLLQKSLEVYENESVESLENRVKDLEASTIVEAFKLLAN